MTLDDLLDAAAFATPPDEARRRLLARLGVLTQHHATYCRGYGRILAAFDHASGSAADFASVPFLPAALFKQVELASVPAHDIIRRLVSSGTDGVPSRVPLDRETARAQMRSLAALLRPILGGRRLPFVAVDAPVAPNGVDAMSAKAAAVAGFSLFGRDHVHLLDAELWPDWEGLAAYRRRHTGETLLIFGFTAMVWTILVEAARRDGVRLDLAPALLLHGGGWKRLQDKAVDGATFRAGLAETVGVTEVRNYYGLVEQVGTIFPECTEGRLHASTLAEVLVRDPVTLLPLPPGTPGLLQLFSAVPTSYPGHSLLTEDVGIVDGTDGCPCGWRGTHFRVLGRQRRAELRGCSDVRPAA